ncbi:SRPBCC domain-containing protein [Microbacterium sp. LRZ72]|uniref:SRPBCC domain-containing protein n=1 Tax=Microbacterium sp. LRZ72 TaxID=2942481 RepID=UPI0029BC7002|nr:SRPBCC domain-containing protein [Microbacterium sp. LRZ72]MDX2377800.1 SRPBCC domain-containing protein [Microbacterium sp. LRZ72]
MARTDEASLLIPASAVRVYRALVTADAVPHWLPPEGMTARVEQFEPKAGGAYRVVLTHADATGDPGKTTADSDVVEGRFIEVVPGVRVVQEVGFATDDSALAGTMTMTWELSAEGMSTRALVRAENVPDGIRADDHVAALETSLAQLAEYVRR